MSKDRIVCPVCKKVVLDFEEGIDEPCEHVMFIYTDALSDEFEYVNISMEKASDEMIAEYERRDGDDGLDILMEEYVEKNADQDLIILDITTYGMACGPLSKMRYSNTDYVMFKLEK